MSDGYSPHLASGPAGLFMLSSDFLSGESNPAVLELRKFNEAADAFEAPTVVTSNLAQGLTSEVFENPETGYLYAVWPVASSGNLVLYLAESTDGGKSFHGEREVALVNGGFTGPPRLAVASDGRGWLSYRDELGRAERRGLGQLRNLRQLELCWRCYRSRIRHGLERRRQRLFGDGRRRAGTREILLARQLQRRRGSRTLDKSLWRRDPDCPGADEHQYRPIWRRHHRRVGDTPAGHRGDRPGAHLGRARGKRHGHGHLHPLQGQQMHGRGHKQRGVGGQRRCELVERRQAEARHVLLEGRLRRRRG